MEVQKAYKLIVEDLILDEPWHYEVPVYYARTAGEAKSKGIGWFRDYNVKDYLAYNSEREVEFTDIKARRVKKLDKILYKDRWETRERITQLEWQDRRDEEARLIWENNPDGIAVVWAGCYGSFWGANRSGYWSTIEGAGKYSTEEAYEIVKGSCYSRQEKVILLDKEKYNKDLEEKIKRLESSLL